jgi:hypothetical protein
VKEELGLKDSHFEALLTSRKKMFLGLVGAALACGGITFFAPINGDRSFYSNVLAVVASGSAFALSLQIVRRQKLKGVFPQMYASLALALGLWFTAEVTWAYYELGLGIETPFPSVADAFWLAGYVPFFYFLIGIIKYFLGFSRSMILPVIFAAALGFVVLGHIVLQLYQTADLSSQDGLVSYIIGSAYPIGDMLLLIPAAAVFIQLRKGKLTFTPWAFIVIAILVFIIADIGFAYSTLSDETGDLNWVWNPLYNIGDFAIAISLLWHKQFFTLDEKKLFKTWQQKNR